MSGLDSITCPKCGMTSHHPTDIEMGYCGNCNRREICELYGVPPWLVGTEGKTWRDVWWWRLRWFRHTWRRNAARHDWRKRWGR